MASTQAVTAEPVGFLELTNFMDFAKLTNFTELTKLTEKRLNSQ